MFQVITKEALLAPSAQQVSDELDFIASDETVDRYGDIIRADGWQLDDFKRNPVVLFAHDSTAPVGTATKIWKANKQLRATIKLAAEGTSELVNALRQLVAQKIIRAVSVGFRPTVEPLVLRDADDRRTGFEFVGQELLEISLVAVGANPHALAIAKSLNLSEAVMRRTFHAVLPDGVQHVQAARAALDVHRLRTRSAHTTQVKKESRHATG